MKLLSIEPTPSPNSMKLNVDERLPDGVRKTYTADHLGRCPEIIEKLLRIPNVKSVFHTADFIAVERLPKGDWQDILAQAREAFGEAQDGAGSSLGESLEQALAEDAWGEAQVLVQMFRGIPLQVRVRAGGQEARLPAPDRIVQAALKAQKASPNLIMERRLEERGVRYGDLQEIAEQIVVELDAAYDQNRLDRLVKQALAQGASDNPAPLAATELTPDQIREHLDHSDWKVRYAALERMDPSEVDIPLLEKALEDDNSSIRRLAVVYLGDVKAPESLSLLCRALKDKTVSVRRTAGDCLSDHGDPAAIPAMCDALSDPSKLVRWRAARFLFEVGDESAISALKAAENDPEFEVSLQVKLALERIEGGEAAAGTVWQQMTRRNEEK